MRNFRPNLSDHGPIKSAKSIGGIPFTNMVTNWIVATVWKWIKIIFTKYFNLVIFNHVNLRCRAYLNSKAIEFSASNHSWNIFWYLLNICLYVFIITIVNMVTDIFWVGRPISKYHTPNLIELRYVSGR